jgi:hypothetical protein
METNWAAEHLQTIRTLMERSAVYRRALAPIMTYNGVLGFIGAVIGKWAEVRSTRAFVFYWASVAAVALAGSFLLVRRQALKDAEPFWSPPTRRITHAMLPPLFTGMATGVYFAFCVQNNESSIQAYLVISWLWLYGCALHAAGFFMQRGIRILGWIFIFAGTALLCHVARIRGDLGLNPNLLVEPNLFMGASFGCLHLGAGLYLYLTEKRKNAT